MGVLTTDRNLGGDVDLYAFTSGIEVDCRLAPYEVGVQKAWAKALGKAGLLTKGELEKALYLLDDALGRIEDGTFEWRVEDEDIHMNLERFVTEGAGELGKKLHTGRSRNDLIATTLRLYAKESAASVSDSIADLAEALCALADRTVDVIVPGTTHLQHGQPVSFGHIAGAHAWAFTRDLKRLANACDACLEYMPLGSAALAGTTIAVDLDACAKELGFKTTPMNSYDAVGDRDFMIEAMDAFASVAVHVARLCEDVIYWSSTAVGLVDLPKKLSTGSSIMPNKRNPDVAELARAKAARIVSLAGEAHNILKAVPSSYGSDLHELKKTFVHAYGELHATIEILVPFVEGVGVNEARARELLGMGHLLATEIADGLTAQGMSFRDAYGKTAALVEIADAKSVQVHELPEEDFKKVLPECDLGFLADLTFENAVEKRNLPGGTSPERARSGIRCARERIGAVRTRP